MRMHDDDDEGQRDARMLDRQRMNADARITELEDVEALTTKRLAKIQRQVAMLLDTALPVAIEAMTRELKELLDQVAAARDKLKAERIEHDAKVKRDTDRIARLAVQKLSEA